MAKQVFIVLSAPQMFGFMRGQPARFKKIGYASTVIAAPSKSLDEDVREEGAGRMVLAVDRDISPLKDAAAFIGLCHLLVRHRPSAVLLSGPKAVFLGSVAAWICGIPVRVIVYHGMRQENLRGTKRYILDACDRVAFAAAQLALAVSHSLEKKVLERGLCEPSKIKVIGNGTANGIDSEKYRVTDEIVQRSARARLALKMPPDAHVIGFVGRITEDKGFAQLIDVHKEVQKTFPNTILLLVGPEEIHTPVGARLLAAAKMDAFVRCVGSVADVRPYIHLMQVFVFPSLREGFPISPMEAAAMGVPAVSIPSTGTVDAIVHGETGVLCPSGDTVSMARAVVEYLSDDELRRKHGDQASRRVASLFAPDHAWLTYQMAFSDDS